MRMWVVTANDKTCPCHGAPKGQPISANPDIKERLKLKKELNSLGYDSNDIKIFQDFMKTPWKYRKKED